MISGYLTGPGVDTYYYMLQELDTVTGLITKNGTLAEAYVYDAYGKVSAWSYPPGDFNRNGQVDGSDVSEFLTFWFTDDDPKAEDRSREEIEEMLQRYRCGHQEG